MSNSDDPAIESISDLNRLIYFSDGVFAIAVTLSAFQIQVPAFLPHGPVIAEWLWVDVFLVRRLLVYRYRRASRSPDGALGEA